MNGIIKNGAMAQLVAHLHGMEGVGGSNPPSSTFYLGKLVDLPRFFLFTFAPRRTVLLLSASSTKNKHHRPEVALDKSSKHELGKALNACKRGERRSLLLIPEGSELGLGLICQGLSQRFGIRCGELSTRIVMLVFASDTTQKEEKMSDSLSSAASQTSEQNNDVHRALKTRHISMIALGGSIGTGLFVASGATIHMAGPGGALLAYAAIGIMVYFLMTSLGEMATFMPISGSFASYSGRFIDPALGFAMGWNYWFNWAITVAVDVSTAAIVLQYWFPKVPIWIFSLSVLMLILLINVLTAVSYTHLTLPTTERV